MGTVPSKTTGVTHTICQKCLDKVMSDNEREEVPSVPPSSTIRKNIP
jgi:hypothetical protein